MMKDKKLNQIFPKAKKRTSLRTQMSLHWNATGQVLYRKIQNYFYLDFKRNFISFFLFVFRLMYVFAFTFSISLCSAFLHWKIEAVDWSEKKGSSLGILLSLFFLLFRSWQGRIKHFSCQRTNSHKIYLTIQKKMGNEKENCWKKIVIDRGPGQKEVRHWKQGCT